MRGKGQGTSSLTSQKGITPAYAGKRYITDHHSTPEQDHPRVCGEKKFCLVLHPPAPGSPPRVRGKGVVIERRLQSVRITPACAGKSTEPYLLQPAYQDHPRVCGEKANCQRAAYPTQGSPPRVRGKVLSTAHFVLTFRITPACAGKSTEPPPNRRGRQDHPRVCGEKHLGQRPGLQLVGSPPRVRGKGLRS